jgi:hypothetical protein
MKDQRLGPRQADVTHWRCRRLEDDGDRKGVTLFWSEGGDGIEDAEWSIKTCSSATISERWGPGRYVVDYMTIDEKAKRRARGTSRVLHVTGRPAKPSEADSAPKAPSPPAPLAIMPPVAPATMDPNYYSHVFSMLAYLEERAEKARAVVASDAKIAQERYRTDAELQLERERLASKERIAQIETQARTVPMRGGAHFDPEALAQRIGEVVGEKVQEALETEEDDTSVLVPAGAAAPDNTAAIVLALKDTLAPILSLVVAKLAAGPTLPDAALPPIEGKGDKGGGKDPKDGPN